MEFKNRVVRLVNIPVENLSGLQGDLIDRYRVLSGKSDVYRVDENGNKKLMTPSAT
jgi:hypothetical protein